MLSEKWYYSFRVFFTTFKQSRLLREQQQYINACLRNRLAHFNQRKFMLLLDNARPNQQDSRKKSIRFGLPSNTLSIVFTTFDTNHFPLVSFAKNAMCVCKRIVCFPMSVIQMKLTQREDRRGYEWMRFLKLLHAII